MRLLLAPTLAGLGLAVALTFEGASAAPPAKFTLSPDPLTTTAVAGTTCPANCSYTMVTVTNLSKRPLVLVNPAAVTQDQTSPPTARIFFDTQGGSCWQAYESLGHPIPGKTTCTIEVGFHPQSTGTFTGTLTATRCTSWHTDATYGFILCDATDGSQTINLVGTGT